MSELINLFKQFGLGLGVLILLAYFLLRHWWPHWKARDERAQNFREELFNRMQTLTETSINDMSEALKNANTISGKIADRLDQVGDRLENLTSEMRRK